MNIPSKYNIVRGVVKIRGDGVTGRIDGVNGYRINYDGTLIHGRMGVISPAHLTSEL